MMVDIVYLGLGLAQLNDKRMARPARGPERDRKILRRCTTHRAVQTARFLWGQGRRAMEEPNGRHSQVHEGEYPIKVSMQKPDVQGALMKDRRVRTDQDAERVCQRSIGMVCTAQGHHITIISRLCRPLNHKKPYGRLCMNEGEIN